MKCLISKEKKLYPKVNKKLKQRKFIKKITTNNSPINKTNAKFKTKLPNNKDNSFSNKNKHIKNSSNLHPKQKSKIKTRDTNIPNNNNNISNKKSDKQVVKKENIEEYLDISSIEKRYNSKNEIMTLKKNLQKNNSENILKNNIMDSKVIENNQINTWKNVNL